MYVESIEFRRTKDSDWEKGYYVGSTDNSEHSIILDKYYKPIEEDENGNYCWDYRTDIENWIQLRCNDAYEIEEED